MLFHIRLLIVSHFRQYSSAR